MADLWIEILKIGSGVFGGAIAGHITARRAERDSAIKELLQEIDRVVDLADDYWNLAPTDAGLQRAASKLKAKMGVVARMNQELIDSYPTYRFAAPFKIIALRRAATGDTFQVAGRNVDPTRIEAISDAADDLKSAVKKARCNIWQVPWGEGLGYLVRMFRSR